MKDLNDIEFVKDEKIDTETLSQVFENLLEDAEKSNKGNGAAGRRFRVNSVQLSKSFLSMRKVTTVK